MNLCILETFDCLWLQHKTIRRALHGLIGSVLDSMFLLCRRNVLWWFYAAWNLWMRIWHTVWTLPYTWYKKWLQCQESLKQEDSKEGNRKYAKWGEAGGESLCRFMQAKEMQQVLCNLHGWQVGTLTTCIVATGVSAWALSRCGVLQRLLFQDGTRVTLPSTTVLSCSASQGGIADRVSGGCGPGDQIPIGHALVYTWRGEDA